MVVCKFFLKGSCLNPYCKFRHVRLQPHPPTYYPPPTRIPQSRPVQTKNRVWRKESASPHVYAQQSSYNTSSQASTPRPSMSAPQSRSVHKTLVSSKPVSAPPTPERFRLLRTIAAISGSINRFQLKKQRTLRTVKKNKHGVVGLGGVKYKKNSRGNTLTLAKTVTVVKDGVAYRTDFSGRRLRRVVAAPPRLPFSSGRNRVLVNGIMYDRKNRWSLIRGDAQTPMSTFRRFMLTAVMKRNQNLLRKRHHLQNQWSRSDVVTKHGRVGRNLTLVKKPKSASSLKLKAPRAKGKKMGSRLFQNMSCRGATKVGEGLSTLLPPSRHAVVSCVVLLTATQELPICFCRKSTVYI
eukprot:Rmarinus@m.6336